MRRGRDRVEAKKKMNRMKYKRFLRFLEEMKMEEEYGVFYNVMISPSYKEFILGGFKVKEVERDRYKRFIKEFAVEFLEGGDNKFKTDEKAKRRMERISKIWIPYLLYEAIEGGSCFSEGFGYYFYRDLKNKARSEAISNPSKLFSDAEIRDIFKTFPQSFQFSQNSKTSQTCSLEKNKNKNKNEDNEDNEDNFDMSNYIYDIYEDLEEYMN